MQNIDTLVIGNQDSLTLFGVECQNEMNAYIENISEICMHGNFDVEENIRELIKEVESFQEKSAKRQTIFERFGYTYYRNIIREYNSVLVFLDQMSLNLKLQQAQILKDTSLIERMQVAINYNIKQVERLVDYAKGVLKEQQSYDSDLDSWFVRLGRRINDLEVSHTVYMQTAVQLQMMKENNINLIDRLVATISNTIPIWKNQVSLLLGIEQMNRNNDLQMKLEKITQDYINENSKKKNYEIDVEELAATNQKLVSVIHDLSIYEEKGDLIKNNLLKLY